MIYRVHIMQKCCQPMISDELMSPFEVSQYYSYIAFIRVVQDSFPYSSLIHALHVVSSQELASSCEIFCFGKDAMRFVSLSPPYFDGAPVQTIHHCSHWSSLGWEHFGRRLNHHAETATIFALSVTVSITVVRLLKFLL